jgi:Ca2+-binding EF-hand superfamily protein
MCEENPNLNLHEKLLQYRAIERMTPEELQECEEAFDMFDIDKDGKLTTKELVQALRALGQNPNSVIRERITDLDVDSEDGLGRLNYSQFLRFYVANVRYSFKSSDIVKDFALIDADNDGKITKLELKNYLESLKIPFTTSELDEMVNAADLNHDGVIDYQEFITMMCPHD